MHHFLEKGILIPVKEYSQGSPKSHQEIIWCCSIDLIRFQTSENMSWNSWEKFHSSTEYNATTMDYIVLERVTRISAVMADRTF